jgi:hypothetical protein
MKKILRIALVAGLIYGSCFAADDSITQNMNQMQRGVDLIQKGFINNSRTLIDEGIGEIMKSTNVYKELSGKRKYLKNVAVNDLKSLEENVRKLTMALATRDYNRASAIYGNILINCAMCHRVVRKW